MGDKLILKNRLKEARAERKMSQSELAQTVGILRNTISSIYNRLKRSLKGLSIMNKEEILSKAQQERKDELAVFINDRSIRWTYLAMVLTAGIFTVIRSICDQPITDLTATVSISVCAGQLYRYFKTKEKFYLIAGIAMIVIAVICTEKYIIDLKSGNI